MSERKNNEAGFSVVVVFLVLVIVILVGVVGFMVHNRNDKAAPAVAANSSTSSQSDATTIKAVINKGDYNGLAAYMATSVKVVKEGTDANGTNYSNTAAAKTIADFYTKSNGAQLPWDFTGDGSYKASAAKSTGAVKSYITQGNIAVSKNDWVLGYNLDSNNKISSFYMSPSVNMSK